MEESGTSTISVVASAVQRFVWKGRYFLAYGFTLGMMLIPLLLGKMSGEAYGTSCTWLFGALTGASAVARVGRKTKPAP